MTSITNLSIASIVALTIAAGPVSAEQIDLSDIPQPHPTDLLLRDLRAGSTIEGVLSARLNTLRRADSDGDGLTVEDIGLQESVDHAQQRASVVARVLAYDLDGNFEITRAEADQAMGADRQPSGSGRSFAGSTFERYDRDGNGKVVLAEATAEPGSTAGDGRTKELRQWLPFDTDGDGRLTGAELRSQVEAAFNSFDLDRDGVISESEFAPARTRVRAALSDVSQTGCPIPAMPTGALLVSFGAYDGQALSSVAVGGQDNETNVTDIVVEPGREPIYLTLTSYESMIWRVTGATARVANLVASSYQADPSGRSAVGVVGLPRDRVTITPAECLRRYQGQRDGQDAAQSLRRSAGRVPDAMFGAYAAKAVTLPSGEITAYERRADLPPPNGFEPTMWRDAIRYWPGGLVEIDPRSVVTPTTVARYEVLPSQMGLAQLLGSGAIQREPGSRALRVVKPIPRMPPGMGGAHSEQLILNRDVPTPPGDPVHSCVRREGSTEIEGSPSCQPPPPQPVAIIVK